MDGQTRRRLRSAGLREKRHIDPQASDQPVDAPEQFQTARLDLGMEFDLHALSVGITRLY